MTAENILTTGEGRDGCAAAQIEQRPEPMDAKRELTDYEKGYLDGLLAYAYRSDGEVYVGRNRFATYEHAVTSFLRSRGIKGWKVKVRDA